MLTKKFLIKKSYPENYFKVGGGGEFTIQMKTWVRVDEDCQLKKRGGGSGCHIQIGMYMVKH